MDAEMTGEKIPENEGPKKKKKVRTLFIYIALVLAGLIIAAVIIFSVNAVTAGESSPEKAVASYLRASMTYDTDGMVKYASSYQKLALYNGKATGDSVLKAYLEDYYADVSSQYAGSTITFSLVSVTEYDSDTEKYASLLEKYAEKADTDNIDALAVVTMKTVIDGTEGAKKSYLAVKCGLRWYYGYAGV